MTGSNGQWASPPSRPALDAHEIHVWRVALDQPDWLVERMRQWLASDEQARASRFVFDHDRARYIVGRGALRSILSGYLGTEPNQLQFEYGPHGKPALVASCGQIYFNASHSKGLGLCAVTRQRELGIDLELVRRVIDAEQIAQRFFSTQENAVFQSLPVEQRQPAFFYCWTRKEAFIKAIGEGLSHPLDQFDVSFAPAEPAKFLSIGGSLEAARGWSLFSLAPGPIYVGALAVEGRDWQLVYWQWGMSHVE